MCRNGRNHFQQCRLKLVRILENVHILYKDTFGTVRVGEELTEWLSAVVRVLHKVALSSLGLVFNIFLKIIIQHLIGLDCGAWINGERISDPVRGRHCLAQLAGRKHGKFTQITGGNSRAFADRRGYVIMSLSWITTWLTWSLQLSEINNIMYAVKTLLIQRRLSRRRGM